MEYTAIIKRSGEWWIGWIEEIPGVNCQESTREELRRSLAEALSEALEFNRQDPLASASDVKTRLRTPAAENHRSTEEEVRIILRDAIKHQRRGQSLVEIFRLYFGPDNGADLELPQRGPMPEPPSFD